MEKLEFIYTKDLGAGIYFSFKPKMKKKFDFILHFTLQPLIFKNIKIKDDLANLKNVDIEFLCHVRDLFFDNEDKNILLGLKIEYLLRLGDNERKSFLMYDRNKSSKDLELEQRLGTGDVFKSL